MAMGLTGKRLLKWRRYHCYVHTAQTNLASKPIEAVISEELETADKTRVCITTSDLWKDNAGRRPSARLQRATLDLMILDHRLKCQQ